MSQVSFLFSKRIKEKAQKCFESQLGADIESVMLEGNETEEILRSYFSATPSDYIFFYDDSYVSNEALLNELSEVLTERPEADISISPYSFVNENGERVAGPYTNLLPQEVYIGAQPGSTVCGAMKSFGINLIGNVGCCLFRKETVEKIAFDDIKDFFAGEKKAYEALLRVLSAGFSVGFAERSCVAYTLERGTEQELKDAYAAWSHYAPDERNVRVKPDKKMTFFYTSKGEYYNLYPIAEEAEERGYETEFTDDIFKKAEIGVYCQHICYPENSKFSVILLHDMAQGHNRWPNLWERERWDKFDIGILPGENWADRWRQCGELYYTNPRRGVYAMGYPQSDQVVKGVFKAHADELKKKFGFKYDFTVLYAPSWENDDKEDELIMAIQSLPVNILIKQAHWPPEYGFVIENIKRMRELHEGKYDNVYYIEPEESILTAIEMCDILVSEESSVMGEALMYDKPSLAVSDWTVPDCNPPRLASVPMDYVIKCKKVQIREYVELLSQGRYDYSYQLEQGRLLFANRGNVCKDIMDAIEYHTGYGEEIGFRKFRLIPYYMPL